MQTRSAVSDTHLLQQIVARDQEAFLLLYERYGTLVFGLALRVVRHQVMAEEVTQDVFLKVWQQPTRWNPALGQFSSWLLTITRNAAIDRLRKERRHWAPTQAEAEWSQLGEVAAVAENSYWYDGLILARLLQQLPPEQRQLIELAFYQGYTHSELAENLQLPLGTVKTRLRTGLQKLRLLWEEAHQATVSK
ncbi:MAG: sigma-70 family RNA polymerase sigma factor [Caldilineaceae bacterium]|nr:sigma-70 family RNA polymerase sigma factor [Caldilineaceae bacterium]